MGRPSILTISEVYWPEGSGGELATHLWVESLVRYGAEVTVVTGTQAPAKVVGAEYVIMSELRVGSRSRLWRVIEGLREDLKPLIKDHDVVYVPRLAWPVVKLARDLGKPVVIHLHDYSIIDPTGFVLVNGAPGASRYYVLGPLGTLKYLISRRLWGSVVKYALLANAYVCVSRKQLMIIKEKLPELSSKLIHIPNPVPPKSVELGELPEGISKPYLIFPGGRSRLKGYHIVKEVIKLLRGEVKVVITKAGGHEVKEEGNVIYVPRLRHGDYIALLKESLAMLHPSIWEEPMPYAVLEAALLKVPIVATAVGGIPEILGRDYPLLIDPKNPLSECLEVVKKLLRGDEVIKEKVEEVVHRLKERLKPEALTKELIKVFEKVLTKYSKPNPLQ